MSRWLYFLLTIAISSTGCHVQNKSKAGNTLPLDNLNISSTAGQGEQILFLTFTILLDSAKDNYHFKLTQFKLVKGQVKSAGSQPGTVIEPGYLYVERTDENKQRVDWIKVLDPLTGSFEFVDTNGTLSKDNLNKKSGEIFLRFQYNDRASFLSIFKPTGSAVSLKKIYHAKL